MERETEARCGAAYGARAESRENSRDRLWDTRAGSVELRVPRLRQGSYLPSFLEPRRTAEKALVAVVQEAYLQGISTRAMDELVKALGASGVSCSEVSRLCEEVQARMRRIPGPPLGGRVSVRVAGTHVRARDGGRIVSKVAILAVGLSSEGRQEVLGTRVGHAENEPFWTETLRDLLDRGVRRVVSDAHSGLRRAVERCLACSCQRCCIQLMRNLLAAVPQSKKELVAATLRAVFAQQDAGAASAQWRRVADGLRTSFPKLAALMEEAEKDALAHMAHPRELWPMLASNGGLERLDRELKKRADVVLIFSTEGSVVRLAGASLMERRDERQVARRPASAKALTGKDTRDDALLARGAGG